MVNWDSSSVQSEAGSTTLSYGQISLHQYIVQILVINQDIIHFKPTDWKHTALGSRKTQNRGNAAGEVMRSTLNLFNKIFYVTLGCSNPTLWWQWLFVIIMAKRVQLYLCRDDFTQISIHPELDFPTPNPIAKIINSRNE